MGELEMAEGTLASILTAVQVVSVLATVGVSIWGANNARVLEVQARKIEVSKPFFELRQKLYVETLKLAVILSNPDMHTIDELAAAKKRFRELYVAELSMVEAPEVAQSMVEFARAVDPELIRLTQAQGAAYELSQAMQHSFAGSYGINNLAN
jgi:hypothetical protein